MKLIFDQNLSSDLVRQLAALFPGSVHVKLLGMVQSDDGAIWTFARENQFVIVVDEKYSNVHN